MDTRKLEVIKTIEKIGKVYKDSSNRQYVDLEYYVAIDLLYYVSIGKSRPYITNDGIDFAKMMEEEYFSHGETLLVKLAWNLFNGRGQVTPYDFIGTLGREFFEKAMSAIRLRQESPKIIISEEE